MQQPKTFMNHTSVTKKLRKMPGTILVLACSLVTGCSKLWQVDISSPVLGLWCGPSFLADNLPWLPPSSLLHSGRTPSLQYTLLSRGSLPASFPDCQPGCQGPPSSPACPVADASTHVFANISQAPFLSPTRENIDGKYMEIAW